MLSKLETGLSKAQVQYIMGTPSINDPFDSNKWDYVGFENVGDDFVYKARALHYDKNKKRKGIYGNASKKQIAELRDEGIETQIFPWIEDNNN